MTDDERTEAAINTPAGSFSLKSKKAAEFIAVLSLLALTLLAYVVWEHKGEAKAGQTDLTSAIKELTSSQREMVSAQREQNCLIALPQDVREQRAEFCKRVTR